MPKINVLIQWKIRPIYNRDEKFEGKRNDIQSTMFRINFSQYFNAAHEQKQMMNRPRYQSKYAHDKVDSFWNNGCRIFRKMQLNAKSNLGGLYFKHETGIYNRDCWLFGQITGTKKSSAYFKFYGSA